jgi:CheY-like chemotaxis protein
MNGTFEISASANWGKAAPPARRKILLVDDDPGIRRVLSRLLAEKGYRVLTAANGIEALAVVGAVKVDLVLLDLTMPLQDGWETFERISTQNPVLPIILITARPDQFVLAQAAGVGALLEKPLDLEKLFHTVHNLLEEPAEACLARYTGRAAMFRHAHPKAGWPAGDGRAEWGAN